MGTTVHPTQTISSLSTGSGNISTGPPTTAASESSHIKLPTVVSSVVHSAIQRKTSLISPVVVASPSVSSKARKISWQFSDAAMIASTPSMIQPPVTSKTNSKFSSRTKRESRPSESSHNEKSSILVSLTMEHSSRDIAHASISLHRTTISVPQEKKIPSVVSTLAERYPSLAVSSLQTESLKMSFADSTKTFVSRTSVNVRFPFQTTENLSSLSFSSAKAEKMTDILTQSPVKPTNWIPFSASDKFSSLNTDSYHKTWRSSSSRFSGHEIRFSSGSDSSAMTSILVAPSASYSKITSQIPHKQVSAATATSFILKRSSSSLTSSRPIPQKRSSAVSDNENFIPSMSFTVTTLLDKSKLQTSSSVPATSPKSDITSEIIVSTCTFIFERGGVEWVQAIELDGCFRSVFTVSLLSFIYTTKLVQMANHEANHIACSIAGAIFSKYWIGQCPGRSRATTLKLKVFL